MTQTLKLQITGTQKKTEISGFTTVAYLPSDAPIAYVVTNSDAALIVEAVNSHEANKEIRAAFDQLLEAAKQGLPRLYNAGGFGQHSDYIKLEKAIAAAEQIK